MILTRHILLSGLFVLALATTALGQVSPGDKAPDFTLMDTAGQEHHLQQYLDAGKTVVLEWFNPDCPFIIKHHKNARTMDEAYGEVIDHDVVWLAINSGGQGRQGAGLEHNQKAHKEYKMTFPVLMDEPGKVGRIYGAKTTPHMFIINSEGLVVYNGAIDDNKSPSTMGETNYVRAALHSVLSGEELKQAATKPYGCSVKYSK